MIFLPFRIGLELSIERLWSLPNLVFGFGSLLVLVATTVIGVIAWGWGNSPAASTVLGACLSLSSTAIIMQLPAGAAPRRHAARAHHFSILLTHLAVVPILGFGRVGGTVAQVLDAENMPYVALDIDPVTVAALCDCGLPVLCGDASRPEILKRVHVDAAAALVVTLDDAETAGHFVRAVRALAKGPPAR